MLSAKVWSAWLRRGGACDEEGGDEEGWSEQRAFSAKEVELEVELLGFQFSFAAGHAEVVVEGW